MQTISFRGADVHYIDEGVGQPLVFLHNGGTSHAIWRQVISELGAGYRMVAPDLPGFGASALPAGGCDLEAGTDLVEALMVHCGLGKATLIGNCMGSAIALGLAQRHPDRVSHLVLINPLTAATFRAGWMGATLRLRESLPSVAKALHRTLSRLVLPEIAVTPVFAFQLGATGLRQGVYRDEPVRTCFTQAQESSVLMALHDDLPRYARFDDFDPPADFPPICTVWGEANRVLSPRAGRVLNRRLKPAREELFAACGHLLMMEQPGRLAALIKESAPVIPVFNQV